MWIWVQPVPWSDHRTKKTEEIEDIVIVLSWKLLVLSSGSSGDEQIYARSFQSKDYRNFRNYIKSSSIKSTGTRSEKALLLILSRDIHTIHTIYTIHNIINIINIHNFQTYITLIKYSYLNYLIILTYLQSTINYTFTLPFL